MSTSLVRKSLDILGCDDDDVKRGRKRRAKKSEGVLDLIPANQRIHNNKKGKKEQNICPSRSKKIGIKEAKLRLSTKIDETDKNIERLLLLSGNRIDPETSEKLLKRALKRRYVLKETEPAESEQTAFTEEDFKQFEKEYQVA
ncbi:active regulator of SIRT1 [Neodiprion pinetum]|uniref:active regulator of SIRT1 n=1 Tax=Neodiprion pinetum TaxID=441929 RepID=UPI001EE06AA1|nr:active regulator of SIRT1-like [Neodiprion pinetum]